MAKKTNGPNKSEEVRKLIKANPDVSAKEAMTTLSHQGIKVTSSLFYFIKGKMHGRKSRRTRARKVVSDVAAATASTNGDALKTILKVKGWAAEVGGFKKLKALVEALSD
jgi:hypothetical protein